MANNSYNSLKGGFQEAFDDLPYRYREVVLTELSRRLHRSLSTINNKKSGRSPVTALEKPIVIAVFRKYGIEINA